jgi:predicted RecA/RadA family phage recombinase
MKNFVKDGDTLTIPAAPYAVLSGGGCQIGSLFGFAHGDAAISTPVVLETRGEFRHAKPGSQAWTVGAPIYWDNAAKLLTSVVGSNKLVGYATVAVGAGAGETTGQIYCFGG